MLGPNIEDEIMRRARKFMQMTVMLTLQAEWNLCLTRKQISKTIGTLPEFK
jgi:hypothetical protein